MRDAPISTAMATDIADARDILSRADRVLVLTGAGISRSAGIQTFADLEQQDPARLAWLRCSVGRFHADPCTVWCIMDERRQHSLRVQPTVAHLAIARWAVTRPKVTIATQNVDGLHERAAQTVGDPEAVERILRLHGTLHRGRCVRCGRGSELPKAIDTSTRDALPHCGACRKLIRPAIIWFGEQLSSHVLRSAQYAAASSDVCLVIGTRLDVYPAADLPDMARRQGAWLIEVNPELAQPESDFTTRIALPSDVAVPALLDGLVQQRADP